MSAPKYDAVLGWHMNPATCGVAKFNHRLAGELGVACDQVSRAWAYRYPLISVKASEIGDEWVAHIPEHGDLLLHDRPALVAFVHGDRTIYYADEIGCPSTLQGNATRGRYRVLVFGMAHKQLLPHYHALKARLDLEQGDYTIEMSCAIHEGNPWTEGLEASIRDMRAIFGDRLRVLGFLGDDAIAKELQECDAVAIYYAPALRRNNTTAWAALAAGKALFTNRDAESPTDPPTWAQIVAMLGRPAIDALTIPTPSQETTA